MRVRQCYMPAPRSHLRVAVQTGSARNRHQGMEEMGTSSVVRTLCTHASRALWAVKPSVYARTETDVMVRRNACIILHQTKSE